MFRIDEELIKAFLPYIKEYCLQEITKEKWKALIDDLFNLEDRLKDGDDRYFDALDHSFVLFLMIYCGAIEVIEESINPNYSINLRNLMALNSSSWSETQTIGKVVLTEILESKGFKNIKYEKSHYSIGRSDVSAKHPISKIRVIGECGPCRLTKVINTLRFDNKELWHLTKSNILYIYKRDQKWDEMYNLLEKTNRRIMNKAFDQIKDSDFMKL